uniref:Uncharacterized protein n=1 Tax=Avena sativa TaxID=4498 RepID=A0ACD5TN83_AVESA
MDDRPNASSASSHRYPDWVMLDPHTRLNYPRSTLDYPEEHYRATNACDVTSKGERIDLWFRAVNPPGASRLYVRWTPRRRTKSSQSEEEPESESESESEDEDEDAGRGEDRWDGFHGREPLVLAAHGNSIILQLSRKSNLSDFFVYTVHSTRPPSLFRLPRCDHKLEYGGLRLDHMVTLDNIGLLCNGDTQEFVVADLMILPKYNDASHDDDTPVVAGLCVYPGDEWKARRPRILHKKGQGKELMWWHTDAVVPCGASLCYVDYFRGVLFLDVFSKSPQLRYVRLPVNIPTGDPYDRGCLASFRNVCVTNGSTMKFVEVVTRTVFVSGNHSSTASSFTINVWRLRQDDLTWEKETTMQDSELWSLEDYGDLLRVVPTFPLVSMKEPNVICFVLSNQRFGDADETWVIVVDMLKKTVQSKFRYNKVQSNCIENDGNMASASLSTNRAFIPCEFSKYLQVPGATRWEPATS